MKDRFLVSTYLPLHEEQDDRVNRQWFASHYDNLAELSCGGNIKEFYLESRAQKVERCYLPQ
ncbi:hypothetical protein [Serratia quinivorans]|uniref:hypothetical protein n=1 Tax=Serratia quinivorans TaxID=137545 RepID=UPI0021B7BF5F|nr:hypothetical protein [Serratia quinivorans]